MCDSCHRIVVSCRPALLLPSPPSDSQSLHHVMLMELSPDVHSALGSIIHPIVPSLLPTVPVVRRVLMLPNVLSCFVFSCALLPPCLSPTKGGITALVKYEASLLCPWLLSRPGILRRVLVEYGILRASSLLLLLLLLLALLQPIGCVVFLLQPIGCVVFLLQPIGCVIFLEHERW